MTFSPRYYAAITGLVVAGFIFVGRSIDYKIAQTPHRPISTSIFRRPLKGSSGTLPFVVTIAYRHAMLCRFIYRRQLWLLLPHMRK